MLVPAAQLCPAYRPQRSLACTLECHAAVGAQFRVLGGEFLDVRRGLRIDHVRVVDRTSGQPSPTTSGDVRDAERLLPDAIHGSGRLVLHAANPTWVAQLH